jgi:hypothetical protein
MTDRYEHDKKLLRLWAALDQWRRLVQPNYPVNMTPHERELAEMVDGLDNSETENAE